MYLRFHKAREVQYGGLFQRAWFGRGIGNQVFKTGRFFSMVRISFYFEEDGAAVDNVSWVVS